MGQSAHVSSIEALRNLRTALIQFGSETEEAIIMLTLEANKAAQWLQHDRAQYWPDQFRKAQNRVVQARNDLERCQLHYGSEDAPSCFDQKKALERAKLRLRVCEEKVKATKKWINTIRQELDDFRCELSKMTNWVETDLVRATAALERMLRSLDKYANDYLNVAATAETKTVEAGRTEKDQDVSRN